VFSCEMATMEIVQRYVANRAEVSLDAITDRSFVQGPDGSKAAQGVERMRGTPLYLYDEPGITTLDIRRVLQTIRNVGFVVVDYIQLMRTVERGENRNLEVAKISGDLKRMAKEFNIPIMALSQLNRAKDEYDEPGLTDLRDSGSLEQDADKVILLWRIEEAKNGALPKIGVKIAKNRMGKTGAVVMYYKGEHMKFLETAEKYVPRKRGRGRQFQSIGGYDPDFPFVD